MIQGSLVTRKNKESRIDKEQISSTREIKPKESALMELLVHRQFGVDQRQDLGLVDSTYYLTYTSVEKRISATSCRRE